MKCYIRSGEQRSWDPERPGPGMVVAMSFASFVSEGALKLVYLSWTRWSMGLVGWDVFSSLLEEGDG